MTCKGPVIDHLFAVQMALGNWHGTGNEMAVLTTYPNRVTQRHDQHFSPARCDTEVTNTWFASVIVITHLLDWWPHMGGHDAPF